MMPEALNALAEPWRDDPRTYLIKKSLHAVNLTLETLQPDVFLLNRFAKKMGLQPAGL